MVVVGLPDLPLDQRDGQTNLLSKDELNWSTGLFLHGDTRECIWLDVLGPGCVGQGEIKSSKK